MSNSFASVTQGIGQIIAQEEPFLKGLDFQTLNHKRNVQNRTIMEILGHLVDSASNNHQRIIRLQYHNHLDFPDYRQDNDLWISLQHYQQYDWDQLIQLWKCCNLHIIHIISVVDTKALEHDWHDFEGTKVSLKEMIEGYLDHLQLHIDQIHELAAQ